MLIYFLSSTTKMQSPGKPGCSCILLPTESLVHTNGAQEIFDEHVEHPVCTNYIKHFSFQGPHQVYPYARFNTKRLSVLSPRYIREVAARTKGHQKRGLGQAPSPVTLTAAFSVRTRLSGSCPGWLSQGKNACLCFTASIATVCLYLSKQLLSDTFF